MIVIFFVGLLVFSLYQGQAHYYRKRWKDNFEVELGFSEEQAGVGDSLYLYETAVNNKKMGLPVICVKFSASKYLHFDTASIFIGYCSSASIRLPSSYIFR